MIHASGLGLRPKFAALDAVKRFSLKPTDNIAKDEVCRGGQVMLGTLRPDQCPAFGTQCRPEHPPGAPMVSSEGACAAYFRFLGHSDSVPQADQFHSSTSLNHRHPYAFSDLVPGRHVFLSVHDCWLFRAFPPPRFHPHVV